MILFALVLRVILSFQKYQLVIKILSGVTFIFLIFLKQYNYLFSPKLKQNLIDRQGCLPPLYFSQDYERTFLPIHYGKNNKRVQVQFHLFMFVFFFLNAKIIRAALDFLLWLINQRTVDVWDAFAILWWRVQCILMAKYVVPPCHQKRRLTLFLIVQHVVVVDGLLFADDRFLFFSFLLFSLY